MVSGDKKKIHIKEDMKYRTITFLFVFLYIFTTAILNINSFEIFYNNNNDNIKLDNINDFDIVVIKQNRNHFDFKVNDNIIYITRLKHPYINTTICSFGTIVDMNQSDNNTRYIRIKNNDRNEYKNIIVRKNDDDSIFDNENYNIANDNEISILLKKIVFIVPYGKIYISVIMWLSIIEILIKFPKYAVNFMQKKIFNNNNRSKYIC